MTWTETARYHDPTGTVTRSTTHEAASDWADELIRAAHELGGTVMVDDERIDIRLATTDGGCWQTILEPAEEPESCAVCGATTDLMWREPTMCPETGWRESAAMVCRGRCQDDLVHVPSDSPCPS